jgi:hypothetical protein
MAPNSGWDESPEHGNFSPQVARRWIGSNGVDGCGSEMPSSHRQCRLAHRRLSRFEKNTLGDSAAWRIHSGIIGSFVDRSSHRRSEVFAIAGFPSS